MYIAAVTIAVEWNPVEVQDWLDAHSTATIQFIVPHDNLVYIFYT